jgi:glycosyltransferase involved in cell wall biosynthesis
MERTCKFSIVTPSYNQAGFIERTIHSVADQQVDFSVEHIVVDGASTDGTLDILKQHSGRIHLISEPDNGMQDALNKGFSKAAGELVGWLNSDDIYLPGTLQRVATYFDSHPDCLWLYGNCRMIDEQDREVRKWITAYKNRSARKYRYEKLLVENFISQPAVFMRREALVKAGPIDTGLPTAMDYDLWIRLAKLGRPGYIDDDLACFRVHGESISSRSYREQFDEQYRIHQKYDHNRRRLLMHRVNNFIIVLTYSVIKKIQAVFGKD